MRSSYCAKICNISRLRYNKIKVEYNKHFDEKKRTIYENQGYSKFDLDFMASELLIKIAEK